MGGQKMKVYGKPALLTAAVIFSLASLWLFAGATGAAVPGESELPWDSFMDPIDGLVENMLGDDDPEAAAFDEKMRTLERVPPMRGIDSAAVGLARAYDQASGAPMPYMQANGRINFYFGTLNPRIICRPLRLTNIELEPGEVVRNVHISDSARWLVSGATSGPEDHPTTHVIIKPQFPDIAANMLIHTDRRTYSLELLSIVEEHYMPSVGFVYPEVPTATRAADAESWSRLLSLYRQADEATGPPEAHAAHGSALGTRTVNPETVYTRYTISVSRGGNIPWKPISVYDAAGRTYIVMPETMQVTESPAFFIKTDGRERLTNYRVDGNLYIIDRLFDVGILQVGGDRVAIHRDTRVADSAVN